MGRIIKTLEECYGIKNGGDRKSDCTLSSLKCQEDLAKELGIGQSTYAKTKKLLDLIPELQDLLIEGKLTTSTASRILARLSLEE